VFDTKQLSKAIDTMNKNKNDFYTVDIDLTVSSIKKLDRGMLTMTKVRQTVKSMIDVLISQIDTVTDLYERLGKVFDLITDAQKVAGFLAGVKTLDKMLLDTIAETKKSEDDLWTVQGSMNDIKTDFDGLKAKAKKCKDENSPERKSMWGHIGSGIKHCAGICATIIISVVPCAICIGVDVKKQNEEFDRLSQLAEDQFNTLSSVFDQFKATAEALAHRAKLDTDALNHFSTEASKMETKISTNMGIASFIPGSIEIIGAQLAPLKQECQT